MIDVPVGSEVDRLERDLLAVGIVAVVLSLCAGKVEEKIVERTVLLNDEDDVGDRRDGGARAQLAGLRNRRTAARAARRYSERGKKR